MISSGRDAWPSRRLLLLVAIVSLGTGAAAGAIAPRLIDDQRMTAPCGGEVVACGDVAFAFLHVTGLPPEPTDVHLPLRGDDVLLPFIRVGTQVLVGRAQGHQEFVPVRGRLPLVVPVGVPANHHEEALVGDRPLVLSVRECDAAAA